MAFRVASAAGAGGSAESFTPTVTFATPGTSSISYGTQTGTYVKIDSVYLFTLKLQFTPTIGTASGAIRIGGLPATATADSIIALGELNDQWSPELGSGAEWSAYGLIASGVTYMEVKLMRVRNSGPELYTMDALDVSGATGAALTATGLLFAS